MHNTPSDNTNLLYPSTLFKHWIQIHSNIIIYSSLDYHHFNRIIMLLLALGLLIYLTLYILIIF